MFVRSISQQNAHFKFRRNKGTDEMEQSNLTATNAKCAVRYNLCDCFLDHFKKVDTEVML